MLLLLYSHPPCFRLLHPLELDAACRELRRAVVALRLGRVAMGSLLPLALQGWRGEWCACAVVNSPASSPLITGVTDTQP